MTKIKSIQIIGKTWFDKVNGNTYCSSRVYFDGEEVLRVPFTYGYGNYFAQRALEILQDKKLIKLKVINKECNIKESFWQYCDRKKIISISYVTEGLKRDCKAWGESCNG